MDIQRRLLQILLVLCCTLSLQVFAKSPGLSSQEKIYVSPDQIQITPHGIFYINEIGDFQPVETISYDEGGVFFRSHIQCSICRAWSEDGSVHHTWCPYYNK